MERSQSFAQLIAQRAVSSTLDSQFRHQLEGVLVRQNSLPRSSQAAHLYRTAAYRTRGDMQQVSFGMDEQMSDVNDGAPVHHHLHHDNRSLEAAVRALREEVNILKNVINASFDMQLDIQRCIRQEVAAAMHRPKSVGAAGSSSSYRGHVPEDASECTESTMTTDVQSDAACHKEQGGSQLVRSDTTVNEAAIQAVAQGTCTICMEASVDSLLYCCGHMCTCSMCGRQLLATGQTCPICRAPVRDVVRAFFVAS